MIVSFSKGAGKVSSLIRCGFVLTLVSGAMNPVNSQADVSNHSPRMIFQKDTITENTESFTPLNTLITEALENNPEIRAAEDEREAAQQRIAPAEALDDPQVEVGVLYMPIAASPFRSEDMTMKMIGLSQNLPFPGKRGLRKDVASKDAEAIDQGYRETINRVIRDLKLAYFDLGLTLERTKLVKKNKSILEGFLHLAEYHYKVGLGSQVDALKAQTQVSRMQDELLILARERPVIEAELIRTLGRNTNGATLIPASLHIHEELLNLASLRETALAQRPQLLALQSLVARSDKVLDLAHKDYYPDFTPRLMYGQRESRQDGIGRADEVSFTVTINLPVWRKNKLEPRVAEALSLRNQAINQHQVQRNEITANLRQQAATTEQSLMSARLYQTNILPQARLTVESAMAAYQVNRVDFLTLLDSQMTVFNYEINLVTALANYNKALAEIDFLVGKKHN